MPQQPLSRRHFVTGAGALGAATIFAPQALAARGKRQPTLRGGQVPPGRPVGRPVAHRDHPVDQGRRRRRAAAAWSSRWRATAASGAWWRASSSPPRARSTTRSRRAWAASRPTSSTTTASPPGARTAPSGRFRTALPPDSRQPVKFAFFSCQDYTFGYYNAHASAGARGHRLRGQPRRLHLRRGLPLAEQPQGRRAHRPDRRGHHAGRLPGQVRPLPQRVRACAGCTPSSR